MESPGGILNPSPETVDEETVVEWRAEMDPKPVRPRRRRRKKKTGQKIAVWSAATLFLLIGIALASVEKEDPTRVSPPALRGMWVTSEESHEDRFIEFREHTIAFGTGGILEEVHAIESWRKGTSPRKGHVRYFFRIVDVEDSENRFVFDHHEQAVVQSIRMLNQSPIWFKKEKSWFD